ncbi:MAG TPA: RNA-guided pseudouridylation complex pseudouridine synthase subunit Cbf5 [Nitrososphaerales archaeon]|nr:RNA-guided pseudouridylation complex pseudouridine synthase subunit Cbf5 [Nitrososphaerales archaeon]
MATQEIVNLDRFTKETALRNETDLIIVRPEEFSNPAYGHVPSNRPILEYLKNGFVVLDKPQGPTSHEVVAWVRKMLSLERAGHSGTLDPMVSGVLPIGLGDATKALSVLLLGPKEYICVARIHDSVPKDLLYAVINQFIGPIYQKPPQRSSVKRVTRTRTIYELEILEQVGNLLLLRILCEAGTYIRKLVYDIGEVIIVGATMVELRRTRVCHLTEIDLVRLHDLHEANEILKESKSESKLRELVKPIEFAVSFLKQIRIRDSAVESLCQGAQLAIPGIVSMSKDIKKGEIVRIMTGKGELVAIAEAQLNEEDILKEQHGLATLTKRVTMDTGTYPKMWKSKSEVLVNEGISEALLKESILDRLEKDEQEESAARKKR